jgi:hypothetical protein
MHKSNEWTKSLMSMFRCLEFRMMDKVRKPSNQGNGNEQMVVIPEDLREDKP